MESSESKCINTTIHIVLALAQLLNCVLLALVFDKSMCVSVWLCVLALYVCVWDQDADKENDITILSFHTCTDSPLLLVAMVTCSRLPSEDGSVISSESVKEVSGKGLSVQKATAQQKLTKEETRKCNGEKCLHSLSTFYICAVRPQAISKMKVVFNYNYYYFYECSYLVKKIQSLCLKKKTVVSCLHRHLKGVFLMKKPGFQKVWIILLSLQK